MLVITTLVLLGGLGYVQEYNLIAICYIIQREIFISSLREFFGQKQIVIKSSGIGKAKTATQMASITCILIFDKEEYPKVHFVGIILLWSSLILGLISAGEYTLRGFKNIKNEKRCSD